jgi:cytochrome c biogenesis protein CcmG, thiol:disulfide interchange protein DsbE
MTHSKVDQVLKGAIAALLVALGFVIVYTMRDHITNVGDKAPMFAVTTDRGAKITPADFGGKVLVLNFWASWCQPCVQEEPSLDEFQKMLGNSGVVVLGISVDHNEQQYRNFLQKFQPSFQTVRDPDEDINTRYGTYKFPESYIIDRNGRVVRKFVGLPDKDGQIIPWTDPDLVGYVKALL